MFGSICYQDSLDDAMHHLTMIDKLKLVKSELYRDHSKFVILEQFDHLKRAHDMVYAVRVDAVVKLLDKVHTNFRGVWDTMEAELEFCLKMLDHTDDKNTWEFFFSDPIHMKWIGEWCSPGPIISSVFPWFDSKHDWTAMTSDDYLTGANHLVDAVWLFPFIVHPIARLVLEYASCWKIIVEDVACHHFVDRLHLELSAMRLGILIPNAEKMVFEVPASLTVDLARKLLSRRPGDEHCRTCVNDGAFIALLEFVGRAIQDDDVGRCTRGCKRPAESQPSPSTESFNVGDEVIITAKNVQDVRNRTNCV